MSRELPTPDPQTQELILNYRLNIQILDTRGQGEAYEGVPLNSVCVAVYNPGSARWFYEPFSDQVFRSKAIALENAVMRAVSQENLSSADVLDTQIMDATIPMPLMDESEKPGGPNESEYLDNNFRL